MLLLSTALCILGLFLNIMAAGNDRLDLKLLYPALGLLALAQAAQTFTLQSFLEDQLKPRNPEDDDDNEEDRPWERQAKFWWVFVSFVAAIFAQFGPLAYDLEFKSLAIVLTAVMGGCFFLFLLGIWYYYFVPRIPNPFKDVVIVVRTAIANRKLDYSQTPTQGELYENSSGSGHLHIPPRVRWLRWLDRAAIVQGIQPSRPASSVEQVTKVKLLLKMVPLWSCFLTLNLVAASGSTFFFEEAFSIEDKLSIIIFFANVQRVTEFTISLISNYIIKQLREKWQYSQQKMELVRIGIGMSLCVLCCIAAWATAVRRQHYAQRQSEEEGYNKMMSVYWLTPRYLLLGLMIGLSQNGLQLFYKSQVLESLFRFGEPFGEFMTGVGKYISIVCILIFGTKRFQWFAKELEDSRLDRYYIFLAVVSFVNFVIYCVVAYWYFDAAAILVEDDEEEEEMAIILSVLDEGHQMN